jgi:hypothetical protein
MSAADFLSVNETSGGEKANDCAHWGLSVWTTEAAVEHARRAFPPIRQKWQIALANLEPEDGVIKQTPTSKQPEHETLWRNQRRDIGPKFRVVSGPRNV